MVFSDYETQFVDKAGMNHAIDELKAYIDSASKGNIDLSDYVTQKQLQEKLDALDIDIDLSAYTTKEELQQAIRNIDSEGYATKTYVDDKVTGLSHGGTTDLSDYYKKQETYNKEKIDDLIPKPITEDEIKSLFANEGYATETYVNNAVSNVQTPDLSDYYTKEEIYNKEEVDNLIPENRRWFWWRWEHIFHRRN